MKTNEQPASGTPIPEPIGKATKLPAVTYRIGFTPLDLTINDYFHSLQRLCPDADQEKLRAWLRLFSERLLRNIQTQLGKAATAGVDQAVDIILDPAYYERRLKSSRKRREELAVRREQEQKEEERRKREGPTPEEIAANRRNIEGMIDYYKRQYWQSVEQLKKIDKPKKPTLVMRPKQDANPAAPAEPAKEGAWTR